VTHGIPGEVFIRINCSQHYLWRAVDQHGNVLDVLFQSRRNGNAATRVFRKLLKRLAYMPRVIITDKLGSYQVAHREILASVEHRRSKYLNNRAENSHQPTRQRERAMTVATAVATGLVVGAGQRRSAAAEIGSPTDARRSHTSAGVPGG
jgi:putative transposase